MGVNQRGAKRIKKSLQLELDGQKYHFGFL